MVSTKQQVLSRGGDRTDARGRLGILKLVFEASRAGGLIGPRVPDGRVYSRPNRPPSPGLRETALVGSLTSKLVRR